MFLQISYRVYKLPLTAMSKLFQSLCKLLGTEKTRTTPYHPQSDWVVERFNRMFEDKLKKVVDGYLPLVMMAYYSSVHESTGKRHARMMIGRDIQNAYRLVSRAQYS